jgi:glycosyltransferase involved in cell wall biosynthesis
VIPAYQAGATVRDVVSGIQAAAPDAVVYVIDDGSTDATATLAQAAGATVESLGRNRGKGAALAAGIGRALDAGAGIIVTLDADGQHPPALLPRLIGPVASGVADMVLGARARSGDMPWGRRFTNWISATVASRLGRVRVPDAQTGYRVFTRHVALSVRTAARAYVRYDYEAAFLLAALRAGHQVVSVEIPTIYPAGPGSHFRQWGDGWRVARVFARYILGAA